jgi:hypothetical protein
MSYVTSAIAIIVCACAGALIAWNVASALDWTGVGGAVAMVIIAMVVATLLYVGGVALGRALRLLK